MNRSVRKKTNAKNAGVKVKKEARKPKTGAKTGNGKKPAATARKTNGKKPVEKTRSAAVKRGAAKSGRRQPKKVESIEQTVSEFKTVVNVSRDKLERWLSTAESKKLHFADEPKGKALGNDTGKAVLTLLKKRRDKYTAEDASYMRKVIEYIDQHLAKRPKGDISASNWRYSLLNLGHDPAK